MNPHDRKRRFNEAIVNMLYPSPDSPPRPQHEPELEPVEAFMDGSGSNMISGTLDDYDNASTSGNEEEHDSETTEKLTRAQRKKIRKNKLKEEALHRGKLIPQYAPPVRSNAPQQGDEQACAKSVKVKQRRMAKRLAKEKRNASTSENTNESSTVDLKEARL